MLEHDFHSEMGVGVGTSAHRCHKGPICTVPPHCIQVRWSWGSCLLSPLIEQMLALSTKVTLALESKF